MLLGCLVTALVFPRACESARVRVAVLVPATAGVTGSGETAPVRVWEEAAAAGARELERLRAAYEARPTRVAPSLGALEFAPGAQRDPVRALTARVLHRDASAARASFVIDAGSAAGLHNGLAVVHGDSLVGIVQVVTDDYARVLRVDDTSPQVVLPVVVLARPADGGVPTRRGAGVANGGGTGRIVVSHLAADEAAVGDLVVTGAGRFGIPDGLVVGEIVRVEDDDRDGEWRAEVRPLRDLDRLEAVVVLVRPELPEPIRAAGRAR